MKHVSARVYVLDPMNHQRQFSGIVKLGLQQLVPSSLIGLAA